MGDGAEVPTASVDCTVHISATGHPSLANRMRARIHTVPARGRRWPSALQSWRGRDPSVPVTLLTIALIFGHYEYSRHMLKDRCLCRDEARCVIRAQIEEVAATHTCTHDRSSNERYTHAHLHKQTFSIASTSEILTEGTYSMVMTRGDVMSLGVCVCVCVCVDACAYTCVRACA